jgi:hypothetical protein
MVSKSTRSVHRSFVLTAEETHLSDGRCGLKLASGEKGNGLGMRGKAVECPRCSAPDDLRYAHWRWFDLLPRAVGLKAYRCRECRKRFYSWKSLPPTGAAGTVKTE